MKFILSIALALMAALTCNAQFIQGPSKFNAISNGFSNPLIVAGGTTAIIGTNVHRVVQVGANGFGIGIVFGTAGVAGGTLVFEPSFDGSNFVTAPLNASALVTYSWTNNGSGASPVFTNLQPTYPNIGNISAIRLKYITNTTAATAINFTNIVITTR